MTEIRLISKTIGKSSLYYLAKVSLDPKTNELSQSIPLMTLPAAKSVDEMGEILVQFAEALAKPALKLEHRDKHLKLPFIDIIDNQLSGGQLEATTPKMLLLKIMQIIYIMEKENFMDKINELGVDEDSMYWSLAVGIGKSLLDHPLLKEYLDK